MIMIDEQWAIDFERELVATIDAIRKEKGITKKRLAIEAFPEYLSPLLERRKEGQNSVRKLHHIIQAKGTKPGQHLTIRHAVRLSAVIGVPFPDLLWNVFQAMKKQPEDNLHNVLKGAAQGL